MQFVCFYIILQKFAHAHEKRCRTLPGNHLSKMAAPQAIQGAERYKKLQAQYNLLSSKAAAGDSLLPDTAYADFLK